MNLGENSTVQNYFDFNVLVDSKEADIIKKEIKKLFF